MLNGKAYDFTPHIARRSNDAQRDINKRADDEGRGADDEGRGTDDNEEKRNGERTQQIGMGESCHQLETVQDGLDEVCIANRK